MMEHISNRQMILALKRTGGSVQNAARLLDRSVTSFGKELKRRGIDYMDYRTTPERTWYWRMRQQAIKDGTWNPPNREPKAPSAPKPRRKTKPVEPIADYLRPEPPHRIRLANAYLNMPLRFRPTTWLELSSGRSNT